MSSYSIPDLLKLVRSERGDRVRVDVGHPPTLHISGEPHEIEGPPILEECADEMLRTIASNRQMRAFRETGSMDIIVRLEGARFLVRATRAFNEFWLEMLPISL